MHSIRPKGSSHEIGPARRAPDAVTQRFMAVSGPVFANSGAEREGFEPSVGFLPHRFSRPALPNGNVLRPNGLRGDRPAFARLFARILGDCRALSFIE